MPPGAVTRYRLPIIPVRGRHLLRCVVLSAGRRISSHTTTFAAPSTLVCHPSPALLCHPEATAEGSRPSLAPAMAQRPSLVPPHRSFTCVVLSGVEHAWCEIPLASGAGNHRHGVRSRAPFRGLPDRGSRRSFSLRRQGRLAPQWPHSLAAPGARRARLTSNPTRGNGWWGGTRLGRGAAAGSRLGRDPSAVASG